MPQPNTTVALLRRERTGTDSFGDPVMTMTATQHPGIYWPTGTSENRRTGQQVTYTDTVCLPLDVDVAAIDAVIPQATVDADGELVLADDGLPVGDRFEVHGQPTIWPRTPWVYQPDFPIEIQLTRTRG